MIGSEYYLYLYIILKQGLFLVVFLVRRPKPWKLRQKPAAYPLNRRKTDCLPTEPEENRVVYPLNRRTHVQPEVPEPPPRGRKKTGHPPCGPLCIEPMYKRWRHMGQYGLSWAYTNHKQRCSSGLGKACVAFAVKSRQQPACCVAVGQCIGINKKYIYNVFKF
jgi:hypothetical protein